MSAPDCPWCDNKRWLWQGRPHEGGDTRCQHCNPEPTPEQRRVYEDRIYGRVGAAGGEEA